MIPFIRGIATPVCALVRNDSVYSPVIYGNVTVTVVPFPGSLSRVIFAP